ncbi:MAG: MotA/TolQ/ExbB proton channel family protein [Myxococcota bacterium]|nr:MotA/TolQ/ExbB proton channel family protein [Myxococcota bacterium]
MDPASVVGLLLGAAVVGLAWLVEGGAWGAILEPGAAVVVLGGTLAGALLGSPAGDLRRAFALLPRAFRATPDGHRSLAERLGGLAELARRKGLMAVDDPARAERNEDVRLALELLVEGNTHTELRRRYEAELEFRLQRDAAAARVFENAGATAPTMGILGAVLGLVRVMGGLHSPEALGAGIATAFVATLYGVALANLMLLPIATKLERVLDARRRTAEIALEGVLAIQEGMGRHALQDRLAPATGGTRRAAAQ